MLNPISKLSVARHWRWSAPLSLLIVVVDQLTKQWVDRKLPIGERIVVISHVFYLEHIRNPGAAWGFLAQGNLPWRGAFFITVTLVAIGMITYMTNNLPPTDKTQAVALSLILGGAIGNLIDRFLYNEVIDFVSVYIGSYPWPNFNIADSAITVGVSMMVIAMAYRSKKRPTPAAA